MFEEFVLQTDVFSRLIEMPTPLVCAESHWLHSGKGRRRYSVYSIPFFNRYANDLEVAHLSCLLSNYWNSASPTSESWKSRIKKARSDMLNDRAKQ